MRYFKAFGQFWYDFVIGDDYKIAVAVIAATATLIGVLRTSGLDDQVVAVFGGALMMAAFSFSLYIDTRRQ